MKITLSLAALVAVSSGVIGLGLVGVAVLMDDVPRRLFVPGYALLLLSGMAWLHHRIDRAVESIREREEAAFQLGKLAAPLRPVPRPRVPHAD